MLMFLEWQEYNLYVKVISSLFLTIISKKVEQYVSQLIGNNNFKTYIAPAVHVSELVQMCFDGGQVVLLHKGEQTLDGQRRHLERGGGVHG